MSYLGEAALTTDVKGSGQTGSDPLALLEKNVGEKRGKSAGLWTSQMRV